MPLAPRGLVIGDAAEVGDALSTSNIDDIFKAVILETGSAEGWTMVLSPTLYAYFNNSIALMCKFKTWGCANEYAMENLYIFGYELLPINGMITFTGLYICSK